MVNEKLLFAAVFCFGIFLSLTVNATMADGNYVLIAYDVVGSGESTLTDANYVAYSSVGEFSQQFLSDSNYIAAVGLYGGVFVPKLDLVAPVTSFSRVEDVVSFSCFDLSSCVTFYSLDGIFWFIYGTPFSLGDGVYDLRFYSVDDVGNTEVVQTVSFTVGAGSSSFQGGQIGGAEIFDVNELVFSPSFIVFGVEPLQSFVLPEVIVKNTSSRVLFLRSSFSCDFNGFSLCRKSEPCFCAAGWCELPGELEVINLSPNESLVLDGINCVVPRVVSNGGSYFVNLSLREVYSSKEAILPVEFSVSKTVVSVTGFSVFSAGLFKSILDFGVVCFGSEKQDCLFRLEGWQSFSFFGKIFSFNVVMLLLLVGLLAVILSKGKAKIFLLIELFFVILFFVWWFL